MWGIMRLPVEPSKVALQFMEQNYVLNNLFMVIVFFVVFFSRASLFWRNFCIYLVFTLTLSLMNFLSVGIE